MVCLADGCSFNELTRTLDHEKPMKAEKTVIIAETIKVLVSLRAENGQFRQHNKLLEVCCFSTLARVCIPFNMTGEAIKTLTQP